MGPFLTVIASAGLHLLLSVFQGQEPVLVHMLPAKKAVGALMEALSAGWTRPSVSATRCVSPNPPKEGVGSATWSGKKVLL